MTSATTPAALDMSAALGSPLPPRRWHQGRRGVGSCGEAPDPDNVHLVASRGGVAQVTIERREGFRVLGHHPGNDHSVTHLSDLEFSLECLAEQDPGKASAMREDFKAQSDKAMRASYEKA